MAYKIGNGLDLQGSSLLNAVIQNLPSAPSSPVPGQIYYDTAKVGFFVYVLGRGWRPTDASLLTDGSIPNIALTTNPLDRTNHTGTQPAATISDLSTVVQTYTLDKFAAPVVDVPFNGKQITGLGTGVGATSAVNLLQMQQFVAASVAGQTSIKAPARACAATSITLSGLQTVDGVSLAIGDRVLAVAQSVATAIGLYIVGSGAWTLAADGNTGSQWVEGTEILIAEGSNYSGTIFRQTTSGVITIGTTALGFVQTAKINTYTADELTLHMSGMQLSTRVGTGLTTDVSGVRIDSTIVSRKVSATITGNGSLTSFVIAHNLGASTLHVGFQDAAGAGFSTDWVPTPGQTTNQITVTFANPVANGVTYTVFIIG